MKSEEAEIEAEVEVKNFGFQISDLPSVSSASDCDLRLQTSDLRLQTSDLRLQTSDLRHLTSDF